MVVVVDRDYGPIKDAYVAWRLTPKAKRLPQHKKDFADQYEIHRQTLQAWDKQEWLLEELRKARDLAAAEYWPDIMDRLMNTVVNGTANESTSAARVLLQHLTFKEKEIEKDSINEESLEKILEAAGIKLHKES